MVELKPWGTPPFVPVFLAERAEKQSLLQDVRDIAIRPHTFRVGYNDPLEVGKTSSWEEPAAHMYPWYDKKKVNRMIETKGYDMDSWDDGDFLNAAYWTNINSTEAHQAIRETVEAGIFNHDSRLQLGGLEMSATMYGLEGRKLVEPKPFLRLVVNRLGKDTRFAFNPDVQLYQKHYFMGLERPHHMGLGPLSWINDGTLRWNYKHEDQSYGVFYVYGDALKPYGLDLSIKNKYV